jgi:hypothetical protein
VGEPKKLPGCLLAKEPWGSVLFAKKLQDRYLEHEDNFSGGQEGRG